MARTVRVPVKVLYVYKAWIDAAGKPQIAAVPVRQFGAEESIVERHEAYGFRARVSSKMLDTTRKAAWQCLQTTLLHHQEHLAKETTRVTKQLLQVEKALHAC